MKTKALWAVLALMMVLFGCAKDQELYKKVDDLGERVTALEKAVKELNDITIPGMQSIVAAIQGNIYVTSVTPTADGYTITFSNQTTAVIKNGVDGDKGEKGDTPDVGVTDIDGQFYWAVDGKPLVDSEGKNIPVYQALPQLRVNDGKWQISYDEGATWNDVEVLGNPGGSTISIEDGDTTVTFYINGEAYEIQKETPFYLVFESRKDLGVPQGDEYMFEYTVSGVTEGDELEVDILNCTEGWKARVVTLPKGDTPGYIGVTNEGNTTGKVFVYAANGRGKTDIKSLVFEEGVLKAEADVKAVVAAGGEVTISVTTNMDYELYVDKRQEWISVAPATKATHTDVYTLVCEPNETGAFRSAEVDVLNVQTGEAAEVYMILQYPSESVATDLASLEYVEDNTSVTLYGQTVLAASENSAVVSDGTGYLYVTDAKAVLPVGKVVTLSGVKRDIESGICLSLTSYEVTAQTSTVTDPETTYYGVGQDTPLPFYSVVTGPLSSEGEAYVVTAYEGQKITIEAPTSNYNIAASVGQYVTVYGYLTTMEMPEDAEAENYTMVINNASVVTFKENAAWALTHKYDPSSDSKYPEVVTNTVSGSNVPYYLGLYSEEAYAELGNDPVTTAIAMSADLQYMYWFYEWIYDYTKEELYDIFVHSDGQTGSDNFKEIDYGKYYIVAAGINPDGTVTGDYKVQEIVKEEPKSVASYPDFLGEWALGESVLTVTEKVSGSTYNVTGVNGPEGSPVVEAEFVDGKFVIKEQVTGAEYIHPTDGATDLYLSGIFPYNGRTFAAYPFNTDAPEVIMTGYVFEEGAPVTVVPGSCSYGAFSAMCISAVIREGDDAGDGYTYGATVLGATMTKYVDNIPDELLGNWICPEKADIWGDDTYTDWTITIEKSGIGVAMKGFDAGMDAICDANSLALVYPIAQYDPETKTLTVPDNTSTGITSGGDAISWRGISGEYYSDIVFNVDFESKTLSLAVDAFVARNTSGAFSGFDAPLVFTKEGTEPAAVPAVKASSHSSKTKSQVKTSTKVSMQKSTVAAKFNAPASRKLDPRVEKSGMASAIKLVK